MPRVLFALLLLSPAVTVAQQEPALSQFVNQTSLYPTWNISLSPDGSHLAYVVSVPGPDKSHKQLELRVRDLAAGTSERICCDSESAIEPSWSRDGQLLAFVQTDSVERSAGGKLSIWSLRAHKITEPPVVDVTASDPLLYSRWIDSNNILIFRNCSTFGDAPHGPEPNLKVYDSFPDTSSASTDKTPSRLDDYRPHPARCLDTLNLRTGHSNPLLSAKKTEWPSLSPDGHYLAFVEFQESAVKALVSRYLVHVVDLKTGTDRTVPSSILLWAANDAIFAWDGASQRLAFRSLDQMSTTGSVSYHIVAPSKLGSEVILEKVPIAGSIHGRNALFSGDGRYFTGTVNGCLYTWSTESGRIVHSVSVPGAYVTQIADTLNTRGQLVAIASSDAGSTGIVVSYDIPRGTIAMTHTIALQPKYQWGEAKLAVERDLVCFAAWSLNHFTEIQALNLDSGSVMPITDGDNRPESMYARYVHITWRSANGAPLEGGLLLPPKAAMEAPHRPLPLIVQVYPSPNNRIGANDFGLYGDLDAHSKNLTLVAAGYALFVPNCPIGPASFVSDLANDVFPGIQKVLDTGLVDSNRIGLLGQSDGVVAALTLLTISSQFKAAVLMDGYADFAAEFGEISGYGAQSVSGGRFVGEPWSSPLSYVTMSPLFRLDHVSVPVLLLHGAADNAVPLFAGEEIFSGLRALGRRAQLVEYPGGGHTLLDWSPQQQNDAMKRVLGWYNTYLVESPNYLTK